MWIPKQSDFGVPGVLNRHGRRHASNMGDDSMRDAMRPSRSVAETADHDWVERNMRLIAAAILLTIGVVWASTSLL
jgi:hypothetical protein